MFGIDIGNDWLVHSFTKVGVWSLGVFTSRQPSIPSGFPFPGVGLKMLFVLRTKHNTKVMCRAMQVTRAEYILLLLSFFAILQSALISCLPLNPIATLCCHQRPLVYCHQLPLVDRHDGCQFLTDAAGLEIGILAGLVASVFYFAYKYARVRTL